MNKFGTARGSSLAKVALFDQQQIVTARSGINGNTDTGGSASDNQHIPGFGSIQNSTYHFFAIHVGLQFQE
jgi:hypothetical protein